MLQGLGPDAEFLTRYGLDHRTIRKYSRVGEGLSDLQTPEVASAIP